MQIKSKATPKGISRGGPCFSDKKYSNRDSVASECGSRRTRACARRMSRAAAGKTLVPPPFSSGVGESDERQVLTQLNAIYLKE